MTKKQTEAVVAIRILRNNARELADLPSINDYKYLEQKAREF